MTKAVNMLSILWLLKTGNKITAKQLAEKLEINIRTVYRYIDTLCASGVPIIADAGHNGGYSLLHEFVEAPLFFDHDEQKALIHAARFAKEAGYPFSEVLEGAVSKLKMYTNPEQLERINKHLSGFDVIQAPVNHSLESTLKEIEVSVAEGHSLLMEYTKGNESVSQSRKIDPYGLVYWKGKWYVVAYCQLRLEIRSFRVDRIVKLSRTELTFKRPLNFSARTFFLSGLLPNSNEQEKLIPVCVQGKMHALDELCQHWLFGHALIDRTKNQASFKLDEHSIRTFVPYFLLPYGKSITILEPSFLKEKLVDVASGLVEHYKNF
ncbi:putative DNA-binding transcriptional regulator YafY [Bacillus pakistanensis]|uniref:DNA-binding transcriptional regulator YafY n=1 Tax=Rossellomorea pakistanensis TaxID=992288 RepID=A0ABS2NJD7_9BACI|nr:YafY family protein [Bacillus pakistanensis]MBM7587954.1 putative DNA-binding transcriptional regulator YafY [Bacillus pakistanensis]